ncbi:unnamed protein product [Cylindrotheca closterium]|uniref:Uncharacterized protein n=1 Tax=Cylindrotheca closterium TaxID=2856 RepID=A0AAD2FFP4_9STRA|nr:unnamed protein product [Cylindrotheca closterium]
MASSFSSLRQQIDNFQALLTAAASSNNVRNYDIRHCLRQIQACLLSEQGDILYDQSDNDEVTQVLMTLLILNDEYADPMILEMVNIITQRAAELIAYYGRELSTQQIQELLPRVLCLLQTSNTDEVVHSLLQLLNQHLSPPRLQEIFDGSDLDCWITLQTVLSHQQKHRSEPTSFLSLSIFIVTLLNHLASNVLPPQKITLPDWIQSQVVLQHENASPMEAKQVVGEYLELLEQFGVFLFESSLHLLEQSAHGDFGSDENNSNQMDINTVMMTLQYSTVATDCVQLCMPRDDGNPPLLAMSFGGILTSLWQALTCFVVQKLESVVIPTSDNAQQDPVRLQMQLAATEALWQLTYMATSNDIVALEESSSSMVVVTILRMLQYPETFWTLQTKEWLSGQVSSTPYKVSLRRALQATTLSQVYHRSGSNAQDHIASLLHEVLNCGNEKIQNDDPWQPLVEELLSEHLALVQGTSTHQNQV